MIVHFKYGKTQMDELYNLRDTIEHRIKTQQRWEYDGHEITTDLSDGYLYMYSQNAEYPFYGIKTILDEIEFMQCAKATLKFGSPEDGVKEITIKVGE